MAVMLLEWVFTSAFLILVVLALRAALGKRVSARLRYALWAVVLMRLLVPVQLFTSPIAGTWTLIESRAEQDVIDWPSTPTAPANASIDNAVSLGGQGSISTGLTTFPSAPEVPTAPTVPDVPEPPDLNNLPGWVSYLGWAWLAGSAVVAVVFLLSNLRFYWQLRRERIPLDDVDHPLRVYVTVGLPSPCLFGVIRPAIYVTPEAAANPDMLRHVLTHEYTHYRHFDHIWSLLRCGVLAVHWWNPLVWVSAVLSQRDAELACDEGALKRLGDGERAAYGGTLLALVTAKPRPGDLFRCATTMAGDKKSLKERISRIAKAPKRVIWAVVVAVLVTALACLCAFGQAEEPEETDQGDQHHQSEHLGPSMDAEAVPEEVLAAALAYTESMYEDFLRSLEIREPHVDNVAFDDWRVDTLGGPWIRNAQGTEVGVWHLDYTCHTTTPERAKVLLAGGMTLSEDGWMTPTDSATWLIFLMGDDSRWQYSHAMQGDGSAMNQPDSDFFWTRVTNGILNVTDPHFTADMTGIPGDVLSLAAFYGQDQLAACQAAAWSFATLPDGTTPEPGQIEFDDWRITSFKGSWRETVNGVETEVWRINCEVHTTQPERAEQAVVGGMYLTKDGWLCPGYRDCTYLVFTKDTDGGWRYRTAVMTNAWGPDEERFSSEGQAQFWKYIAEEAGIDASGAAAIQPWTPDLNRNGVPETLRVTDIYNGTGQRVELWEDDELIYSEEASTSHVGWNAVFLCALDGEDYLLRYNPYMNQGVAGYSYRLFTLAKDGQEQVVRENSVDFDINFHPLFQYHSFDPEAIAAFMDEINGLLANSVQLINTDDNLLSAFEKEGQLYDSLCWLDHWEPVFTRDENKSLLENLKDFQAAMKAEHYAKEPTLFVMNETEENAHVWLTYQDRNTQFDAEWEWGFQPEDSVDVQVLDWNNDGKDEIVFSLIWGHGTGVCIEKLYVFDADTLEQYDTSGLNEMILSAIQSTGDEDNLYLSGLGLDVTIPKSEAQEMYEYAPVADDICFDNIIRYTVKDGKVFCGLGCDVSGALLNYIGYINVPVRMTSSGSFVCGQAQYTPVDPYF